MNFYLLYSLDNLFEWGIVFYNCSSKVIPLVSGIKKRTNKVCKTIKNRKIEKICQAARVLINTEPKSVISAAIVQWTRAPKDCPFALILLGNISEMKTQITLPCPIAWEAMKTKMANSLTKGTVGW